MSTRIAQIRLQQDATFQLQVASSLQVAAFAVMSEDPSTTDHVNRLKLAKSIVAGGAMSQALLMMPWVLSNPTVSAAAGNAAGPSGTPVDDASVDFVVNSLFTQFADAFAAQ